MLNNSNRILVVGAGTIGLSTAWHLANRGHRVLCIDPHEPPSVFSAGHDLNKVPPSFLLSISYPFFLGSGYTVAADSRSGPSQIVRTEYDSVLYTKLAHEAIAAWRTPPFAPAFHETGWLFATSREPSESTTFRKSIENTKRYGDASRLEELGSREAIRAKVPLLTGDLDGWTAVWNGNAGWVEASHAMKLLRDACAEKGVEFLHGAPGALKALLRDDAGRVLGVTSEDGSELRADATVLCLGAWSDSLLDFEGQLASVGIMIAHIQLTDEERAKYATLPVIDCEGLGYFFPPNEDGILKIADLAPGRTHFVDDKHRRSVPYDPREPIPEHVKVAGEAGVRKMLRATLPELADKEIKEFKV
jgi:sarcosine oxidase / L-pipecolate oxidase